MPTIEAHYELQTDRSNKTAAIKEKRETCLPALSARYSKNTSEKKQKRADNYDFKSFKAPSSVASSAAAKPAATKPDTLDVKKIKLNESSSKRLAADNTAMTNAMRTTANTSGGGMPSLIPPPKPSQASENLASGNSARRSRSNKRSTSKSGRGSDLDHVFEEAER